MLGMKYMNLNEDLMDPAELATYNWVKPKVLKVCSEFCSKGKLRAFLHNLEHCCEDEYTVEPPLLNEPVCRGLPSEGAYDSIFQYCQMFTKLNMPIPFSEFECSLLRRLNVAHSQLHINSWDFIRSFELACRFLHVEPTVPLFSCFYYTRRSKNALVGWTSLYSVGDIRFIKPYSDCFKRFSSKFFKVLILDDYPYVIFEDDGTPKFPLYWTRDPVVMKRGEVEKLLPADRDAASKLQALGEIDSTTLLSLEYRPAELPEFFGIFLPYAAFELNMLGSLHNFYFYLSFLFCFVIYLLFAGLSSIM